MNQHQRHRPYEDMLVLIVGIWVALFARFLLKDFETQDFWLFTGQWMIFIREHGIQALRYPFTSYTPFYSYLLIAAYYLFPSLPNLILIKLVSTVFDFVCAWFVYKLVRLHYASDSMPYAAALTVLLAPTVLANSAFWGWSDVIYTTGLVACIYYLATQRNIVAMVAFSLAFAFKPQAFFILPLLVILFLKRQYSWTIFLIIPATYALMLFPVLIAGRPLDGLFTIYQDQVDLFQTLTMNAPNMYQWFPNEWNGLLYPAGWLATVTAVGTFIIAAWRKQTPMTPATLIELGLISTILLPFFLPRMHERYFFAADILSIAFAFYFPRYWWVPVTIITASFLSYAAFLFKLEIIPLGMLAIILGGVLMMLLWHYFSIQPQENQ
jgi:Gpi18-like mannosyltransferase